MSIIKIKQKLSSNKLVLDSIWALTGNIIAKGLALIAAIIVARFLGKEIYGEYGMIRNTVISLAIFSTFGLGYSATKFVAEYKDKSLEVVHTILRYSIVITLLTSGIFAFTLFIFADYVAREVLSATHLAASLKVVSVWVLFNAVTTTQVGILAGFGKFKEMARINTITGIVSFCLSFILTYFWKLNGALFALLVAQILNWFLNFKEVNKYVISSTKRTADKDLLKSLINSSLPIALQEAVFSAASWMNYLLLIKFSSYGELGLYSAAMQWGAVILFIPAILRNVVLSHMSQATSDNEKYNSILKITLLVNFIATSIPFIIVFVFTDFFVGIYGESFTGLDKVLNITLLTTIFMGLSNVYTQAYISKGKNWLMFKIRLFRDLSIPIITYIMLYQMGGAKGATYIAYSTLVGSLLFLVIMKIMYDKTINKDIIIISNDV